MDLVRSQIASLADTHGGASPSLTFTGGALTAVRPEDTAPQLERELAAPLQLEERVSGILLRLERELDAAEESIGAWPSRCAALHSCYSMLGCLPRMYSVGSGGGGRGQGGAAVCVQGQMAAVAGAALSVYMRAWQ